MEQIWSASTCKQKSFWNTSHPTFGCCLWMLFWWYCGDYIAPQNIKHLLGENVNKLFLIIHWCACRTEHCSALIREAASCTKWELTQSHGQTVCREWGILEHLALNGCLYQTVLFKTQVFVCERRKFCKGTYGWLQGDSVFQKQDWHTWTQTMTACTMLHRLKPTKP